MRKVLTLIIISALVLGAVGTAFAEENNDLSAMITEGKLRAAMADQKEILIEEINSNLITLSSLRESVVKETEATGKYSNGELSAIGQYESLMIELLKTTQNTKSDDTNKINSIKAEVYEIEEGIMQIDERLSGSMN